MGQVVVTVKVGGKNKSYVFTTIENAESFIRMFLKSYPGAVVRLKPGGEC